MPANQIKIGNQYYDCNSEHFSFYGNKLKNVTALKALALLPHLRSADFTDSGIGDTALEIISQIISIENLCLQGTQITNEGLHWLPGMKNLEYLRLKDNFQLGNECAEHLLKIEKLKELQVHETSINQQGLEKLSGKTSLRFIVINLDGDNYNFDGLMAFSKKLPQCTVLVKGNGEFLNGKFEGKWK